MAVKSIISVDIQDEAFGNLKRRFDQFDAAVKKLPSEWRKLGSEIVRTEDLFKSLVLMTASVTGTIRELEKVEAHRSHHTEVAVRQWATLGRSARDFARSVAGATGSIMKWVGIGGLLGGLLGGITTGLGIERLAVGAATSRRFAMGIGAGIGETRAFEVSGVERLLDPKSFLESVARMKSGVMESLPLFALGLGAKRGLPTPELGMEMIKAIKNITETMPGLGSSDILKRFRLEGVMPFEAIERIRHTGRGELGGIFGEARKGKGYGLNDADARTYEDFMTSLGKAGKKIEATFQDGLVPLVGPLSKLVDLVPRAVDAFMRSPALARGIETLSNALDRFATYVGTQEFSRDVKGFTDSLSKMVVGFGNFFNSRVFRFFFGGGDVPGSSSNRADIYQRGPLHREAVKSQAQKLLEGVIEPITGSRSETITYDELLKAANQTAGDRSSMLKFRMPGIGGYAGGEVIDFAGGTNKAGMLARRSELQDATTRQQMSAFRDDAVVALSWRKSAVALASQP